MPRLPIAVASPVVVEVHVLVDVLHAVAGHLKHGDEEGLVVGRADPVTLPVSEIFHPDLPEKRDQEGSHVSELLPYETKQPVLGFSEGVGPRVTELEVVLVELAEEVIGVGHCGLFSLVDCIDNLKHLLAKELIVPTHNHSDILRAAVVENRIIDVGDCASALLVADESETSRRELIPRDEELDQVGSAVLRGVIDEDSAVVAVVLVDDRLYVVLVTIVLGIVSRGDYHAEGQLLAEGAETVFLLQSIHLFFDLLLHVALLQSVYVARAEVESTHRPGVARPLVLEVVLLADLLEHPNLLPSKLILGVGEQGLDQRLPLLQLLLLLDHSLQEIQGNLLLLCLRRGGELLLQALHCSSNHLQHLLVELAKAGISQFLDQLHLLLCIRCRLLQARNDLVYFPLFMGQ